MKIVQATEYFLPDAGRDIERFVYELSQILAGAGQSVTMLACGRRPGRRLGGVQMEYASVCGARISSVNSGTLAMHRQKPDVVHAHHFGSGYAASLLKKYDGTPYVLTVHRVDGPEPKYREMYRKALEGASSIISASGSVKEWLESDFGVLSTVIPDSEVKQQAWKAAISQYISIYESAAKT